SEDTAEDVSGLLLEHATPEDRRIVEQALPYSMTGVARLLSVERRRATPVIEYGSACSTILLSSGVACSSKRPDTSSAVSSDAGTERQRRSAADTRTRLSPPSAGGCEQARRHRHSSARNPLPQPHPLQLRYPGQP